MVFAREEVRRRRCAACGAVLPENGCCQVCTNLVCRACGEVVYLGQEARVGMWGAVHGRCDGVEMGDRERGI